MKSVQVPSKSHMAAKGLNTSKNFLHEVIAIAFFIIIVAVNARWNLFQGPFKTHIWLLTYKRIYTNASR